jgi:uncharacterized protein YuzE
MITSLICLLAACVTAAALFRSRSPVVTYDRHADVLYVVRPGVEIVDSLAAETDGFLILNYDDADDVVGVQMLGVSEMPSAFWATHPDRNDLPTDILTALDRWLGASRLRPPARDGERLR